MFLSFAISPLEFVGLLTLIAVAAGLTGALLGLGGGVFLVPAMVVLFGIDIQAAIVASLVSVIGTSSGSAATYLREGVCDLRVAMFLEVATVVGGIAGALVAVTLLASRPQVLALAFVPVVLLAAVLMYRSRASDVSSNPPHDPWADRLQLHGRYFDTARKAWVEYRVTGTKPGLLVAGFAGIVSGLLGIGGGVFAVPAMNSFMNVPVRIASATSNFMIGVTATAGALVYFFLGHLAVGLAAPVAIGVLAGSFAGARLHRTAPAATLKGLFVAILLLAAVVMLLRGTGVLH
ncbi:MAG: sulfite exporter TauE/SafE family protein [Thermoplasmata archaeon]|nr:sulfite exporter TauE/SafE family protein [Thermoplasmata archaeon]